MRVYAAIRSVAPTVVAFCIAPAIPSILICFLIFFYPKSDVLWVASLYGGISYVATAVFGIPIYLILKYYRVLDLVNCLAAGVIIAIVCYGYIFIPQITQVARTDNESIGSVSIEISL